MGAEPLRCLAQSELHEIDLGPHLGEVDVPLLRILPHRALHDRDERRREGGVEPVERCGLLRAKLLEQVDGIVAAVRLRPP